MDSCSIIATSDYCYDRKDKAISNVEKIGFSHAEALISEDKFFDKWAGSPTERLELFHKSIKSKSKAIIACLGGTGSTHFVKDIDFSLFKKHKKIFMGYSNLTPIVNLINQESGIISLYGPTALQRLDEDSLVGVRKAMMMEDYGFDFNEKNVFNIEGGIIEGKVVAGNLRTFVKSVTLNLGIDFTDKIAFIEDKRIEGEKTEVKDYNLYNYLVFLKNYSLFKPKAIMLGGLGITQDEKLKEMVEKLFPEIPIVAGLPFGHQVPNIPIPVGATCVVDIDNCSLRFKFPETEKGYAVKFDKKLNLEFSESFNELNRNPESMGVDLALYPFSRVGGIDEILEVYKSKNYLDARKIRFTGVAAENVKYMSAPVNIGGNQYFLGTVEHRRSKKIKTYFFRRRGKTWAVELQLPPIALENMFITKIKEKIVLGGIKRLDNGHKKIVFYSGTSLTNLEVLGYGPEDVEEINLIDLHDGNIGVLMNLTKKSERIKIGFTKIKSLEELSQNKPLEMKILKLNFGQEEWGGFSDLHLLDNGLIGVLAYFGKYSKNKKNQFCYPAVFCLDPETCEVSTIRIILRRGELPEGEVNDPSKYNVLNPRGIIRKEDSSILYTGVGDMENYEIEVLDPFKFYEQNIV